MKESSFIEGAILEIKLLHNLGFAYCKVLDFRHIRQFDGVLVKIYDYIVREPIKNIDVLSDKELLFGPRRMPWLPNTRGKGSWKFKGILVSGDDRIIPDFKYSYKYSPLVSDESEIKDWYVLRNINELSNSTCGYKNVKHLENSMVTSQEGIIVRIVMEYCRINKIDITTYFDLSDEFYLSIYHMMINTPIYSTIPISIRGKAKC